jgi:hypothetical protein
MSNPPAPASAPPRPHPVTQSTLGGFLHWLFTGFGLLGHYTGGAYDDTVTLYTVQPSFFLWALLLVGFAGGAITHHWPGAALVCGWVYVWVLVYTLITVLFDINTPRFLLWVGIFLFVWLACRYVELLHRVPVLAVVVNYFAGLHPALNRGFAVVISWLLLPAWIASLVQTFARGKKVFTPNSIEEHILGQGHEVTDRSGLHFRTNYRDIFESVLGMGAGDLEAVNAAGVVVKRWPNVLFLAFVWKRLDAVLRQRASLVDNPRTEPVEVEDAQRG